VPILSRAAACGRSGQFQPERSHHADDGSELGIARRTQRLVEAFAG